jgi:hypothetical protein
VIGVGLLLLLSLKGGADQPRLKLINATRLATGDELPMSPGATSEDSYSTHYGE